MYENRVYERIGSRIRTLTADIVAAKCHHDHLLSELDKSRADLDKLLETRDAQEKLSKAVNKLLDHPVPQYEHFGPGHKLPMICHSIVDGLTNESHPNDPVPHVSFWVSDTFWQLYVEHEDVEMRECADWRYLLCLQCKSPFVDWQVDVPGVTFQFQTEEELLKFLFSMTDFSDRG
jgi:hypothetical protein